MCKSGITFIPYLTPSPQSPAPLYFPAIRHDSPQLSDRVTSFFFTTGRIDPAPRHGIRITSSRIYAETYSQLTHSSIKKGDSVLVLLQVYYGFLAYLMYKEAFTKLELAETATILDKLNPEFEGVVFDPLETTILAQNIPFYPGFRLLDIADHSQQPPRRRFAVYSLSRHFIINFSNEPIYAFNRDLPIQLDENNVGDYVRFFFNYVRGKHGRFIIVESVDDINWKNDPPLAARRAIGRMIAPVTLEKTDEKGHHHLRACMIFKDSLFKSAVRVEPNGLISLSDEELLVEDIPVLDDALGQ